MHKNTKLERAVSQVAKPEREIALRKPLTGNKTTQPENLGNLACKIKCKWENQLQKTEMRLEGE